MYPRAVLITEYVHARPDKAGVRERRNVSSAAQLAGCDVRHRCSPRVALGLVDDVAVVVFAEGVALKTNHLRKQVTS